MLAEKIDRKAEYYLESCKGAEAPGKRWIGNEEFLALISSLAQTRILDARVDQRGADVFGPTYMVTGAKNDPAAKAEANIVNEATACPSSESSSEERFKGRMSCRTHHRTCSRAAETGTASQMSRF